MDFNSAIAAIGADEQTDWLLRPDVHAEKLKPSASHLREILTRPDIAHIIDIYNEADRKAVDAQSAYKRLANTATVTSFLAIVVSSMLLLPAINGLPDWSLTAAGFVQGGLILTSFVSSLLLVQTKSYSLWMSNRALAETERAKLFTRVFEEVEGQRATGKVPLLLLQLEYFRRYQLDVQRTYYGKRGAQHARSVRMAGFVRMIAVALIVSATIPIFLQLAGRGWFPAAVHQVLAKPASDLEVLQRLFLALSLIGGALQGLLASSALSSQRDRNAERYLDTSKNLDDLATRPLDEARQAAAAGDRKTVLIFAALVNDQLNAEHAEWVKLRSLSPELSIEKLRNSRLPRMA